jgi:hypothetical protein
VSRSTPPNRAADERGGGERERDREVFTGGDRGLSVWFFQKDDL